MNATLVSSVSGLLSEQLAALLRRKLAPAAFREALEELILASRPAVEATFVDTILAGWLSGAAAGAEMLPEGPILAGYVPPPGEPPALELLYPAGSPEPVVRLESIERAVDHLRDRAIFNSHDFYALQAGARQQAFTISASVTESTLAKVNELLAELTAEAPSLAEFRERVLAAVPSLPIGEAHLEQVYRNSVNEAYSQGQERVLEHPLVQDEFPYRLIVPIHDERARPEHRALEFLGLDGSPVYHKDDPTWLRFRPPWSWNAVLPGTVIEGRAMYALKTAHSGDVCEMLLESGRRLSVTKQHPILTAAGFVAAGSLCEGVDLLSYGSPSDPLGLPVDHIDDPPSKVDDLFDAFDRLAGRISVEASALDFHGDPAFSNPQIDVVGADAQLMRYLVAELSQRGGSGSLVGAHLDAAFLSCKRAASKFDVGRDSAAGGVPNQGEVGRHSVAFKSQFRRIGSAANLDASLYESRADGLSAESKLFGELQLRFPRAVFSDKVVDVKFKHYSGPVYDVQTSIGYMVANGIVVSNCRCGWIALSVEDAAAYGVREAQEWLATGVEPAHPPVARPPFDPDPRWERASL